MSTLPERVLAFQCCFNFRDIGGYRGRDGRTVQWRRLFRSMTPEYMNDADAASVALLGIDLVIDFRGERYAGSGPVCGGQATRIALSPVSVQRSDEEYERFRTASPQEALPELLEVYGEQYAAALTAMAERPDANVLFHCRLGKDRTGVFAALLLKLLGVADEDVIRDYLLTGEHEPESRRLLRQVETDPTLVAREPLVAQQPPSREALEGMLRLLVTRYGGVRGYFEHYGVSPALLDAFVESRLEPLPSARETGTAAPADASLHGR